MSCSLHCCIWANTSTKQRKPRLPCTFNQLVFARHHYAVTDSARATLSVSKLSKCRRILAASDCVQSCRHVDGAPCRRAASTQHVVLQPTVHAVHTAAIAGHDQLDTD